MPDEEKDKEVKGVTVPDAYTDSISKELNKLDSIAIEVNLKIHRYRIDKLKPMLDILSDNVKPDKVADIRDVYLNGLTASISSTLTSTGITDEFRMELLVMRQAMNTEYMVGLEKRIRTLSKLGEQMIGEKVN